VLAKLAATVVESKGIAREIHPVGPKTVRSIKMLRNGSGSKTVHQAKVGKAKAKGKERRVETEIAKPNLCATIGVRATATVAMLQLAISHTMALKAEINKRKRDKGSTSLPAKAVKRAKKKIMAMVMEGIKGDEKEPAKAKGSKVEQASETLLALVRGEKKRKAASMISVDLKNGEKNFVPSNPEPKEKSVLMIPRQWSKAQEFRPVNRKATQEKDTSNKKSGDVSSYVGKDMSQTENDDQQNLNLTKTDPLSIRKSKRETLKSDRRQDPDFLCGDDCKFRGKDVAFEPGVLGSGSDEAADSDELEAERRAEEKIDSWNALGRERQAQDQTQRKTVITQNPTDKVDPNQVRVTLTTRRDAQGRVTGTSSSRSLRVPANLDMKRTRRTYRH
jgi:hypothetical protein